MKTKELFEKAENGVLNYEQFEELCKQNNVKMADLSEGGYVSKSKYDNDLKAKDDQIKTLNDTISTRETDLANVQEQLKAAGADSEKLTTLQNNLTALQGKYDTDKQAYEEKLNKQAYEFAVKEFAATKKFTSQAAKRDFTQSMIAGNLSFKDGKILGAEDFVKSYTENNADAFVVDNPDEGKKPAAGTQPLPQFVAPTHGGDPTPAESNPFSAAFSNFVGVRPIPQQK